MHAAPLRLNRCLLHQASDTITTYKGSTSAGLIRHRSLRPLQPYRVLLTGFLKTPLQPTTTAVSLAPASWLDSNRAHHKEAPSDTALQASHIQSRSPADTKPCSPQRTMLQSSRGHDAAARWMPPASSRRCCDAPTHAAQQTRLSLMAAVSA